MSVLEMAHVRAAPDRGDDLELALPDALAIIAEDEACLGATAYRCVERPGDFTLLIGWTSVADHERFRESDTFGRYRAAMAGLLGEVVGFAHHTEVGRPAPVS